MWTWLERCGLTPPIVKVPSNASLVRAEGRLGPWSAELSKAIAALPAEAPVQESFRSWLLRHVDAKTAEAIIGVAFIPTFEHDPGGFRPRSPASAFAERWPAAPGT